MVAAQEHSTRSPYTSQSESALKDESPSAKLVAYVLQEHGELTKSQLSEYTLLPTRTTRYALQSLEEADLVSTKTCLTDARKNYYQWIGKDH